MRTYFRHRTHTSKGFTLLEIMVSISIFAVVSALIMADYPKFNKQTALTSLVNQIAISVREAQVNGISVRSYSSTVSGYSAYGLFFGTNISGGNTLASSVTYSTFVDIPDNTLTDARTLKPKGDEIMSSITERINTQTLGNGNTVERIFCRNPGRDTIAGAAFIVFRRPNPDAKILYIPATSNPSWTDAVGITPRGDLVSCGEFHIRVSSQGGTFKKDIVVYSSGQIAIE